MTKPLRIALIMQGRRDWIAGAEYIRNIILALGRLPEDVKRTFEISLIITKETDRNIIASVRSHLKEILIADELVPPTLFRRVRWFVSYRLQLPDNRYDKVLERYNFDFVYPYTGADNGYNVRKVAAWIPDFQHKYLAHFFTEKEIRERDKLFGHIARRASLIVLSSRSTEEDFRRFYPEEASKVKVLSFKTIPRPDWREFNPLHAQAKYSLPDKFFLISNQFWQHKNHIAVFEAMKLLKEKAIYPVVVCTGHIYDYRQPEYSDIILQTIHKAGLAHQVYLLGLIPKMDQVQLLRRSIALMQPSLFEGWSTVVEEARCLGKPVVLSDIAVHKEQNPPNAYFFERNSPEALAQIMADRWQTLSPGPDLEQEDEAREIGASEIQAFARQFLAIAREAHRPNAGVNKDGNAI